MATKPQYHAVDSRRLNNEFELLDDALTYSTNADRIPVALIGSAYEIAVSDQDSLANRGLKDIDIYVREDDLQDFKNITGFYEDEHYDRAAQGCINARWNSTPFFDVLAGLDFIEDHQDPELGERALEEELEKNNDAYYSGETLEVVLPSPGVWMAAKGQQRIEEVEGDRFDFNISGWQTE